MIRPRMLPILALLGLAAGAGRVAAQGVRLDSLARAALDTAAVRYARAAARLDPANGYPRYAGADGIWKTAKLAEWTSGFFPGTLWQLYAYERSAAAKTGTRPAARRAASPAAEADAGAAGRVALRAGLADTLRAEAARWTAPLPGIFQTRYSHDLGFQFFTTDVAGYRLTGDARYRATALEAARLLAGRFNPAVGAIKSWDWMQADRPFPVIADNMMNLELLFWGAKHGGSPEWAQLARRHAETTRVQHVRADGGSFHVVVFDPETGKVRERVTHQGYADSTTWARGEAWLLYGFTMAYRETRSPGLLETARRVADYFVSHLPPDGVPCWDFQAPGCPGGTELRDASAAAIAAAGLLELARYAGPADAPRYRGAATGILTTLLTPPYFAGAGADALLLHATGNRPARSEVDVALIYGDYYLVEALRRYLAPGAAASATP